MDFVNVLISLPFPQLPARPQYKQCAKAVEKQRMWMIGAEGRI